jgi:hypothetical protein
MQIMKRWSKPVESPMNRLPIYLEQPRCLAVGDFGDQAPEHPRINLRFSESVIQSERLCGEPAAASVAVEPLHLAPIAISQVGA